MSMSAMPSSHSCRCEKCWSLRKRCLENSWTIFRQNPSCRDLRYLPCANDYYCLTLILTLPPFAGLYGMNFVKSHPYALATRLELYQWPPGFTLAYTLTCIVLHWQFGSKSEFDFTWLLPFHRTILILIDRFWGNTFSQRWHQLLAGFQLRPLNLLFTWACWTWRLRIGIFAQRLNWLQMTVKAHFR